MGTISRPNDYSANTTISSSQVNDDFDTIYNEFNGNISAANLSSDAITTAKITDLNVTTAKIADSNVTTAKLADASVTNAKLATSTGELGAAWQAWTPTFTNLSGGALSNSVYTRVGKTIYYRFTYTLAGAGVAGAVSFTPPVTAAAYTTANDAMVGNVKLTDTGTADYFGPVLFSSTTSFLIRVWNASGTYLTNSNVSSTVPHTWANTDIIFVQGFYEAA